MPEALLDVLSADLAVAYLIVVLAGVARGFTGFVAGLINVALLTLLYGPVEAIALSAIFGLVSSGMLLRKTFDKIQWREIVPFSVAVIVTLPFSAMLLLVTDSTHVKPVIGVLVIACGLALVAGWKYSGPRNVYAAATVGLVCGGVQGFTGSGGPLMVFYYLASPEPTTVQRANIAAGVSVICGILIITLLLGGGFDLKPILRAAILFPGVVFGTWAGTRLFEIAPQKIFSKVAQWALIAIGLALVFS